MEMLLEESNAPQENSVESNNQTRALFAGSFAGNFVEVEWRQSIVQINS